jgi:hypothetical protein
MDTNNTKWDAQRGEGRIGAIIGWIVFLAIGYAAWQLVPVYFNNYAFKDKMVEVARRHPGLPTGSDQAILDTLVKEQRERNLQDYFAPGDIKIQTEPTRRRIYLKYIREVEVLPNYKRKITFENDVEMPLL